MPGDPSSAAPRAGGPTSSSDEAEWKTRKKRIDPRLDALGWTKLTPGTVALHPYRTEEEETDNGPADYGLWLNSDLVGIVEAKKVTVGPQNVLTQAARYSRGARDTKFDHDGHKVPFLYSTNGEVFWFHDVRHHHSRSRQIAGFNNAVSLKKLLSLIGDIDWSSLGEDVKAHAYEGLLEKAASEGKKGAGQYFTPRVLIRAIVRCMKPDPRAKADFTVCDPAVGTGGFLVAVHDWLDAETKGALERNLAKRFKRQGYHGGDIDPAPRRLALMNLYLHGIEPDIQLGDAIYEPAPSERFDVILTNPPFGTRGANQAPERDDFTVSTSNKQLNFVQHVLTLLKPGGRAAIVLPDNCLFEDQAGEVFKILMEDCDLHTVLRLPRGTFTPYSQGVKANVIFFTKGMPSSTTWIYDARTNVPQITKKDRPLTVEHFMAFEKCFGSDPNGRAKRKASDSKDDRWRSFGLAEIKERNYKLDGLKWLKDDSLDDGDELAEPEELVTEAIGQLEGAVAELNAVLKLLENGDVRAAK